MNSSSNTTQELASYNGARKVALIIGNQDYKHLAPLNVTRNDAKLVEKILSALGFQTFLKLDLRHDELVSEIKKFGEDIVKDQDLVYFYYSGHAGQQSSKDSVDNYLFGIDARQDDAKNLKGISFRKHIQNLFNKQCIFVIILDACRNYPKEKTRFVTKSATVSSPPTINLKLTLEISQPPQKQQFEVIFACQPGKFAIEETVLEYGLVARAFCDGLQNADRWDDVRQNIVNQVREETGNRQIPVVQTSLSQTLHIRPTPTPTPTLTPTPTPYSNPSLIPYPNPSQSEKKIMDLSEFFGRLRKGKVENAEVQFNVKSSQDDLEVDLTQSGEKFLLKGLKFIQHKTQVVQRDYLYIKIRQGQYLEIQDCEFIGIGLSIVGDENNLSGNVQVNNLNMSNANDCGLSFRFLDSVLLNEIQTQKCGGHGQEFVQVKNVEVRKTKVFECIDSGFIACQIENFNGQNIEVVKCDTGFLFQCCQGKLIQVKIKECEKIIDLVESQIIQQNVECL